MLRNSLRVLSILVLVLSLTAIAIVRVDAMPGWDRATDAAVAQAEPETGWFAWFGSLLDQILSLTGLAEPACDPQQDPDQCTGDGSGAIDVDG